MEPSSKQIKIEASSPGWCGSRLHDGIDRVVKRHNSFATAAPWRFHGFSIRCRRQRGMWTGPEERIRLCPDHRWLAWRGREMAPPYRPRNLPVQRALPGGTRLALVEDAKARGLEDAQADLPAKVKGPEGPRNARAQAGRSPPATATGRRYRRDGPQSHCLSAHSYKAQALFHRTHRRAARRACRTVVRATHTPLILVLPMPHPTATCVTMPSGGAWRRRASCLVPQWQLSRRIQQQRST